jgi:hypothetical protein
LNNTIRPFDWLTYRNPDLCFFVIPIYIKDKLMFVAVKWTDDTNGAARSEGASSAWPELANFRVKIAA